MPDGGQLCRVRSKVDRDTNNILSLINVGQHGSAAAASKFDKFRWRILHWSSVCGARYLDVYTVHLKWEME